MKIYLKPLLIVLPIFILFLLVTYYYTSAQTAKVPTNIERLKTFETIGLPSFNYRTWAGSPASFSEPSGQIVIINFWASWCAPCIEEIPSLIKLVNKYQGKIKLIAVSGDSDKKDIEIFLKSFPDLINPNIDLVWDEDHSIMQKFGVERMPESFVSKVNHRLAKKIIGTINWYTPGSLEYVDGLFKDTK